MWEKISDILMKSAKYIYGIIMFVIVAVCLFCYQSDYACKRGAWTYPTWCYMLLGLCGIILIMWVVALIAPIFSHIKHKRVFMLLVSSVLFVVILFLAFHYYFATGWDVADVMGTAEAIADGNDGALGNYYMSLYPNNILLSYIFSVVIRIGESFFGITNGYICPIIMQCFLFALAGYYLWDVGYTLFGGRVATLSWIMYLGLVAGSPWVTVPYSDSTGLVLPIGTLWLFVRALREKKGQNLYVCLIAFFWYIGFRIKPQISIVGIAILLWAMLKWLAGLGTQKGNVKQYLRRAASFVLGLVLSVLLVGCCEQATHLQIDDELSVNVSYYLMMGLNETSNGVINVEDYNYSFSIADKEERADAEWKMIGHRLEKYGVTGLAELLKKKTLTNYMDGSFAWWIEGNFLSQLRYEGQPLRGMLEDYYYATGTKFSIFMNQAQVQWMGVLLCAFFAAFQKKQGNEVWVVLCSLIGIALFEWLFEARARYLFTFVPLYILIAGGTITNVFEGAKRRLLTGNNKE